MQIIDLKTKNEVKVGSQIPGGRIDKDCATVEKIDGGKITICYSGDVKSHTLNIGNDPRLANALGVEVIKQNMSNNSNDPKTSVNFEELAEMKISVENGIAHLFVGNTPKAQLSINMRLMNGNKAVITSVLKKVFPIADIEFQ